MSRSQAGFVRSVIAAVGPDLATARKWIEQKLLADIEDTKTESDDSEKGAVPSIGEEVEGTTSNLEIYVDQLMAILENGPSLDTEDSCQGTACLGALLEWLGSLGNRARRTLRQLEMVLEDANPKNRRAFDRALAAMRPSLRQSPLGIVHEFVKNTQPDLPGIPIMPTAQDIGVKETVEDIGDESMEVTDETKYTLAEAADYAGTTESEIDKWLASGVPGVNTVKDSATAEYAFSASDLRSLRNHNISVLVASIFDTPNDWLDSPNPYLGGFAPRDLLGSERDVLVLDLLEGICHGVPT